MERSNNYFKNNQGDLIWWLDTSEEDGKFIFTFDKKKHFNLFADYPHKLTPDQKKVFDKENPYWAEFFSDRTK